MSDNKGSKIWQWAVLLLVLCNVALVATMWLKPHPGHPPMGEGGGGPRNQVVASLKFTDEQVIKYDALIQDHQQKMKALNKSGAELKQILFAGIGKNGADAKVADSLTSEIGTNQKQIELITYNHFEQVRALCNEQQKLEFDRIIVDITRNMNRGHGSHRPPPDRDGRPEEGPDGPPGDRPGPPPGAAGVPPPNQK